MSIAINPIFPVISAQGAAPEVVLQPGTVIDAQVLKILSNDLVRIAIANLTIEVLSEIPLQPGQDLQLAVSQTQQGIKLAVVGQDTGAVPNLDSPEPIRVASAPLDTVTLAPEATASAALKTTAAAPPKSILTALEALAVSAAAQSAATRQAGLSSLFANLGAVAASNNLPPKLQQAIAQVLAQRTTLSENLTASDVKSAVQKSGLFFEATLASGVALPASGVPDLKAALIVLKEALSSFGAKSPALPDHPQASAPPQTSSQTSAQNGTAKQQGATSAASPSVIPEIELDEILLPRARLPVADDLFNSNDGTRIFSPSTSPAGAAARAATSNAALNLLQELLQPAPQNAGNSAGIIFDDNFLLDLLPSVNAPASVRNEDDEAAHTNTPPPPFRGALPSAQPVASPSLVSDPSHAAVVHHLHEETESAIARQTLLQVASLPDRVDIQSASADLSAPRWNFEIPFATQLGTAIAQFEISRDGSGVEAEAAKQVWRARFSLDVEPAGPIHALVSLSGEKTSVRLWAERPATASQLRASASQLSQALSRAELKPGDIVIGEGAPAQSASAPAGYFLDRAL